MANEFSEDEEGRDFFFIFRLAAAPRFSPSVGFGFSISVGISFGFGFGCSVGFF
tara:strand:- start:1471 stop:1632 length:162 start_codon:yes stop_codon:yes gene_type:complete